MNLNHLFDRRLAETDLMLGETASDELRARSAADASCTDA